MVNRSVRVCMCIVVGELIALNCDHVRRFHCGAWMCRKHYSTAANFCFLLCVAKFAI
jgi:hypothetical protein